MAHRLVPRSGQHYLSPRIVVSRLVTEFGYVASSEEDGRRYVQAMIQELRALRQRGNVSVDDDYLYRLRQAEHAAIYVYFGDPACESIPISAAVIPGEPLFFTFPSDMEQSAVKTLLARCANSLNYDVVEE
jgi:hypothetical protein